MNSRILPMLALMVAVGMFFAYVSRTWNGSIAETKAAIAFDDQALAAADRYVNQQKELIDARDAIDPVNLERLSTFLPNSVDNVGLILDLNALAAANGLSLSNIDVTVDTASASASTGVTDPNIPARATSPVGSVELSLSAVGTYAALQKFLDGVEKSERLLDVRDLVVKGSETGVYTYQMKIRLYWLR